MKKSIIVVTILMLIIVTFFVSNTVYAEEHRAIDERTESKIVELKESATNSMEDYKEKYRFRCVWNCSIYFKYSAYL